MDTLRRDVIEMRNVSTTKLQDDECGGDMIFNSPLMYVMDQEKNLLCIDRCSRINEDKRTLLSVGLKRRVWKQLHPSEFTNGVVWFLLYINGSVRIGFKALKSNRIRPIAKLPLLK